VKESRREEGRKKETEREIRKKKDLININRTSKQAQQTGNSNNNSSNNNNSLSYLDMNSQYYPFARFFFFAQNFPAAGHAHLTSETHRT
jgi:hypothetical protein